MKKHIILTVIGLTVALSLTSAPASASAGVDTPMSPVSDVSRLTGVDGRFGKSTSPISLETHLWICQIIRCKHP